MNKINAFKLISTLEEKGLTRSQFATDIMVDKSTITRLIQNGTCTVATASKIVKSLNLTPQVASEIFFPKSCGKE